MAAKQNGAIPTTLLSGLPEAGIGAVWDGRMIAAVAVGCWGLLRTSWSDDHWQTKRLEKPLIQIHYCSYAE